MKHVRSQSISWTEYITRGGLPSCSLTLTTTSELHILLIMNSFLFPEDLAGPTPLSSQPRLPSLEKAAATPNHPGLPPMPTRAPPRTPRQDNSLLSSPLPTRAPPPIPTVKEEPAISIIELNIASHEPQPDLQRKKSKREVISFSHLRGTREPKAKKPSAKPAVELPPLSPIVDDEFWRTGRYPTSPQGFMLAHVPF